MVGEIPVLVLQAEQGGAQVLNLASGKEGFLSAEIAAASARSYLQARHVSDHVIFDKLTTDDQWILNSRDRSEGFYRFHANDAGGNQVYVSRVTGDVVQATDKTTRRWAWFGAIPHWIYPAILRRHPALWHDVVIILSGSGVFLTITGLSVGFLRLKKVWPFSVYRGWHLFHHICGTVSGLMALAWITSGFLTMNPAGLFQGQKPSLWQDRLSGYVTGSDIVGILLDVAAKRSWEQKQTDWQEVDVVPLGGHPFLVLHHADGRVERFARDATPVVLTAASLEEALQNQNFFDPDARIISLDKADDYYFDRPLKKRRFPVLRAAAPEGTLLYIDAQSGELSAVLDTAARHSRWLVYGVHDLDFFVWLRSAAAMWMIVLPALCGVMALYVSAIVLAVRRLRRTLR